MPRYLEKRRRRWYAKLDIPRQLRPAFGGRPRFIESLQTESLTEAERRCPILIAKWKAEIEVARTGDTAPLQHLREKAKGWRDLLDDASNDDWPKYEMILQDEAEQVERQHDGAGLALYKVATRQWVETSEKIEEWLATLDNEPKSIDMKRSDLKRLCARFKTTRRVSKKAVQRWALHLQHEDGLKPQTVRRIMSACRGYWSYLQRLDVVADDVDPFHAVVPAKKKLSKRDVANKRRAFQPSDVVGLLRQAANKGDRDLVRLIWLGMWTGCRIEELCALGVHHVEQDRFWIEDAKSEAGWREVPIHSQLRETMAHLRDNSTDGYVLSGLTRNKYADRSNAVGKRFGRLKASLGYGPTQVFHSIRMTVTTQLDAAGVPEAVSARIVGHDIPTLTYGLYSAGAPFDVKLNALEALSYPTQDFDTKVMHD
ncbi:phage integrase family protein [Roseovarius halotolerans]|uniref:Site-specific tyrosine recombinase XerD n=1 Tax=Roseovarius halotolerans TaxID=505353 RepID=A0A1X6YB96_9RHOB|nr:DUF6538 domain-containing protein [Roseovarius halotolerans]RKT34944.1 phage integrase family protein [Roseovarius halotolerans]SLN16444.1 site-specific tyrosine recombinase XerD [Roseovarius halotolerans]